MYGVTSSNGVIRVWSAGIQADMGVSGRHPSEPGFRCDPWRNDAALLFIC
jgi:hypothetical protein